MNFKKKLIYFGLLAIISFFLSLVAFKLGYYFGQGKSDPDYYESIGYLSFLLLNLFSIIFVVFAFSSFIALRNTKSFKDLSVFENFRQVEE